LGNKKWVIECILLKLNTEPCFTDFDGGYAMIYFAHFSFESSQGVKKHGYFTCIVDAGEFQAALKDIRRLLRDLERRQYVFEAPVSIYLDDLIEVRKSRPKEFWPT
jgi:hypothetical protein